MDVDSCLVSGNLAVMPIRSLLPVLHVATLVLAMAACGEEGPLDELGSWSQDAVLEGTSTTTTFVINTDDGVEVTSVSAGEVEWFNDRIELQFQGESTFVITRVWQRRESEGRFIQASRREIASALPEIRFPKFIPSDVGWITSQLVFDVASATLDREISAAFGLWAIEPYTVTEGRIAVLWVGQASEEQQAVSEEISVDVVEEGLSLNWTMGAHRYELFCRASLSESACWQMAETTVLLATQLGEGQ